MGTFKINIKYWDAGWLEWKALKISCYIFLRQTSLKNDFKILCVAEDRKLG